MQKIYYSSVISFDILLLLVSIIIFAKPVVKSTPILCNQTKSWTLDGRNIVADSKGFVLLVVLMPMQCEHCHKQLMKFQTIMETLPEIKIVVVAPYGANSRLIERYRKEFSRITIGMESLNERIWNILSGSAHDHFIYDRCGRLANLIRHPKSDATKSEHTLRALKLAVNYAQCGWCQYNPANLLISQKSIDTTYANSTLNDKTKKTFIKAVIYRQNDKRHKVNSDRQHDIAPDHERFSLRTNTISPMRKEYERTSDDHSNQKMVISGAKSQQQQRISMSKKRTSQQTQPKIESNQRRVMIGPDNNISRESDWRVLNGSHPFSSQMSQNESQDCEQQQQRIKEQQYRREQRKKQQKLREQNERKEKEKYEEALEQLRIQQEHRLKIRQQEEERRRAEEQLRLQEIRRQHEERQYQERQRLYQQEVERRAEEQRRNEEFRRRTEEQLRLQEQKMKGQLYTDVNGDEERRRLVDQGDSSNWRQFKAPPHHQQYVQNYSMTTPVSFDSINPTTKTSSLYDDYDYLPMDSEITPAPTQRTQILGTEPPEQPTILFDYQVPCAAFTDKICIEQKKRLGADRMSKCCDKGIYLTDLCMPEHCTNATTELCCMQKFLQAKYKCCLNDSKAINTAGDAFSRCCYYKFVQDDDKCCPAPRAKFHWLTAHEICLPNVRVDLSDVRFSVRIASSNHGTKKNNQESNEVVTVDLNADKSWDHSCEQGAKVFQFPYLPVDELAKVKVDDESGEERR